MPQKKHKPEEIVAKLRQVDVLLSQGPIGWRSGSLDRRDAVHVLPLAQGVRWPKSDQLKRLKELEKENERLRKAVSDLTLEKLILREAASGNFWAPPTVAAASIMSW